MTNDQEERRGIAIIALVLALIAYPGIAWGAFQWRNPTANQMAFWRELPHVLRFERMEKYQGR